jgi:hypothetical protein
VSLGEYCGIGVAATEGGVLQRESRIGVIVKELMKKTTDRESTKAVLRHFSNIYE